MTRVVKTTACLDGVTQPVVILPAETYDEMVRDGRALAEMAVIIGERIGLANLRDAARALLATLEEK